MITITPSSGSVTFDFDGNQYYLNNGSIAYPLNTLSMTIDESNIITFKTQSGDIALGCHLDELGKTKAEMEELYESSFVGSTGGGVTSGEVETMIDSAVSGKADTSALTAYSTTSYVDSSVSGKANTSDVNEALEVASRALFELKEGKQDVSGMSGFATTGWVASLPSYSITTGDTASWTSAATNASQALTQLGGNSIVALTQQEYDALTVKDAHTLYIITA